MEGLVSGNQYQKLLYHQMLLSSEIWSFESVDSADVMILYRIYGKYYSSTALTDSIEVILTESDSKLSSY